MNTMNRPGSAIGTGRPPRSGGSGPLGCGSEAQTGQLAWPEQSARANFRFSYVCTFIYVRMIALYLDTYNDDMFCMKFTKFCPSSRERAARDGPQGGPVVVLLV